MQIGQLNNLIYPDFGNQPALTNSGRDVGTRPTLPAKDTAGVTSSGPSTSGAQANVPLPADLVYSDIRKTAAIVDTNADAARAAEQHQQAIARSADSPSSLSVGKDGVLVSKPATSDTSSQAFVTFAVNTMRQYADEQERLKSLAKDTQTDSPSSRIPRSMGEVQKLAARFKLFA